MEKVPLKDLKENLSEWTEKAHQGAIIEVTKYNRPYIKLVPGSETGVFQGAKAGQTLPESPLRDPTGGKWLDALTEDREEA